jgi:hypothetical protein
MRRIALESLLKGEAVYRLPLLHRELLDSDPLLPARRDYDDIEKRERRIPGDGDVGYELA